MTTSPTKSPATSPATKNGHAATKSDPKSGSRTEGSALTSSFPRAERIAADIERDGFVVYQDAVSLDVLRDLKQFWVSHFHGLHATRETLDSNLRLGEASFDSHSDNAKWNVFRRFDFLWNQPLDKATQDLVVEVHRVRNKAQGMDEDEGLKYSPNSYGIYGSTSCYPCGEGRMRPHTDGHKATPILHFMVPITHKGIDYETGGLFVRDRQGKQVDIDAMMKPGSVAFYDGRVMHGVDTIGKSTNASTPVPGRIACFAIPTFFRLERELPPALRRAQEMYLNFDDLVLKKRSAKELLATGKLVARKLRERYLA